MKKVVGRRADGLTLRASACAAKLGSQLDQLQILTENDDLEVRNFAKRAPPLNGGAVVWCSGAGKVCAMRAAVPCHAAHVC